MIEAYQGVLPQVDAGAFVHPSAVVIGKVKIGKDSSIWPCTVVRGDDGHIVIGERTSVQDGSILHLTADYSETVVGDECTIGHNVILHGCRVANRVLVGMGAILLDNVQIGELCLIGAGTVITANRVIPPRSLVLGNPGKVVREVGDRELMMIHGGIDTYVRKAREFLAAHRPA